MTDEQERKFYVFKFPNTKEAKAVWDAIHKKYMNAVAKIHERMKREEAQAWRRYREEQGE